MSNRIIDHLTLATETDDWLRVQLRMVQKEKPLFVAPSYWPKDWQKDQGSDSDDDDDWGDTVSPVTLKVLDALEAKRLTQPKMVQSTMDAEEFWMNEGRWEPWNVSDEVEEVEDDR